ncbi:MAG: transglutaminase-like domain-containing protein, partial [Caldilineaceae bacterium]
AIAAFAPVVSVQSIADMYARLVAPVDERLEGVRRTTFPNVQVRPRLAVAGTVTGLPNDFLLGSGPELSQEMILTLRTSDGGGLEEPAEAPYLRALLLDEYTGLGWEEGITAERFALPAAVRLPVASEGRRLLAQTVRLSRPAATWFVAAEPVQLGADAWVRRDAQGQFITATGSPGAFTALSATPALSEAALAALPPWGDDLPLPPGFEAYLALPESVTPRTVALARSLTQGISSPYGQAHALQEHLRAIPYDLEIPAPPPDTVDVADWFLFDLQRGYCDYFATAFVVMARSIGLPARFVVGYAPGNWTPYEQAWQVTAAQSHAWAEVYLPEIGWIPFEPTGSRAPIERRGAAGEAGLAAPPVSPEPLPPVVESFWTWQMLFWLAPILLLAFGGRQLWMWQHERRSDPWQALQAWGAGVGRPPAPGETTLEYAE